MNLSHRYHFLFSQTHFHIFNTPQLFRSHNSFLNIKYIAVPKTIRQRRIASNESPEHSHLSKVPSPQLGIYRGNQKMHFMHTTGNESTPIASGNCVAFDSPESLSKHTNDGNSHSSNSGVTVTVTPPVQRPSKLRGKTVLLKHLEIDERFYYKSPPSALNIDGEINRNENTKKVLSSPKSDGDLNARRLSSMENEKENGRSPFIRNFERRTISDDNRSKVRVFEGETLDLKAGTKNSSVSMTRDSSQNPEQFMNESISYTMDSIGSTLRGKLSLSPTASELHEKKEVENGGGGGGGGGVINAMSRLKCDINSKECGYGTAEGSVFKRTTSDTLNIYNSEVKESKITDYSIERKNSKEKENKSSYDNLSVKKRIMKPSPPLSQPPKSKEYVINKREHSPPIIDFSSHSPSNSSTESKTNFFLHSHPLSILYLIFIIIFLTDFRSLPTPAVFYFFYFRFRICHLCKERTYLQKRILAK